jgi:NTP pyrophosphatase (non-canonical NTP hydrolase)
MSRTLAGLTGDFETTSALYAERCGIRRDAHWFLFKLQEELGELVQAYLRVTGRGRDKGETLEDARLKLEDKAADLPGQLLTFASHMEIDLAGEGRMRGGECQLRSSAN